MAQIRCGHIPLYVYCSESAGPRWTTVKRVQTMKGTPLGGKRSITSSLNVRLTRKKEES